MKIIGLYTGKLSHIGEKRSPTGIYKQSVDKVTVDELGIVGDIQADKRFHGGVEKALHQYALSSYEKIIKRYPLLHKQAKPGAIGENLSATAMNEHNVCIGDIYNLGTAILQVSSPRIPCWKIDAKFKQPDLNQFISLHRLNGWYYRVLQPGEITIKDEFLLQQRPNAHLTIDTMLKVIYANADEQSIELATTAIGLDPEWQNRLQKNTI
ncbi:MOSC domain-containing protein [Paraglaciecola arctica]|uniref:MOSC domain-containing protein n=1 Tax=Paraglaciecola arctica BSs20135 TaxID=493475 RepID=K6XJ65_9ALTE|nr:MOSC domain-containing protein [Paraglaciecola arctica]GAC20709.1 MOSC domain-containing protein [Paraglaciecola arctica BSs20135]